jgi:dCMP deaminase
MVTSRPSLDVVLLDVAASIARRGTCSRAQVGAVVAVDGRICSTGFNGSPHGLPHCDHPVDEVYTATCTTAVHAEANAVAFAARHGVSIHGATLYTTTSPCLPCAMLIVNAGITRVIYAVGYRSTDGVGLLESADVVVASIDDLP